MARSVGVDFAVFSTHQVSINITRLSEVVFAFGLEVNGIGGNLATNLMLNKVIGPQVSCSGSVAQRRWVQQLGLCIGAHFVP